MGLSSVGQRKIISKNIKIWLQCSTCRVGTWRIPYIMIWCYSEEGRIPDSSRGVPRVVNGNRNKIIAQTGAHIEVDVVGVYRPALASSCATRRGQWLACLLYPCQGFHQFTILFTSILSPLFFFFYHFFDLNLNFR